MIAYPRSMPTFSTRVAVWATERVSAQMIAGRTGTPAPSSSTAPIIWPEKDTTSTSAGATAAWASRSRVARQTASHQSPASCSALPRGPKSVP